MNTEFMKGVVVPILTVIDGEEKIDEAGMRDQVEYVIQGGVSGILAFGSNGEFYMVEEDEMERGLKIMVDQSAGLCRCTLASVPSAPKSAAVWHRWRSRTAQLPSACCSPCS